MYCLQCGQANIDGAIFCQGCGANLPVISEEKKDSIKQSGLGITSFVLAMSSILIIIVATFIAVGFEVASGGIAEDSVAPGIYALIFVFGFLINLVGVGFGIAGMVQKMRKRVFSILGLIFNGLGVISMILIFIAAMVWG